MNKKLSLFSGFIFFVLISCDNVKSSTITIDNYENASFHMGRGLNKYLNNVLTYQKWDDQENIDNRRIRPNPSRNKRYVN